MALRPSRARGTTVVVLLVLAACGSPVPPDSSPALSSAPDASSSTLDGDTLAFHRSFGFLPLSNLAPLDWGASDEQLHVHAALYRLDDHLRPVPHLAEDLCEVDRGGLTVTCQLREATFHDGSTVTVGDVVFSYEVARSPECPFVHVFGGLAPVCIGDWMSSVSPDGADRIRFELTRPHAAFVTEVLPNVFITPQAVLEGEYAALAESVASLDDAAITAVADRIDAGLEMDPPECEADIGAGEDLLDRVGAAYAIERGLWAGTAGEPGMVDACRWGPRLSGLLRLLGAVPQGEGIDGLASAYPLLPFNEAPVGAGAYRLDRIVPGDRLELVAFDAYVGGRAQIDRIVWLVLPDSAAADAVRRGELHVSSERAVIDAASDASTVRVSDFEYTALQFNVREGAFFADRRLRQAVAKCADMTRLVAAASPGAQPIVSPIVPTVHWAYLADLTVPERDVDEARRIVEEAGWTSGGDGVYERGGERLAFQVVYRADSGARSQFLALLSDQLTDCGMQMTPVPADFDRIGSMFDNPPHLAPDSDEPFDAYFGAWSTPLDPSPLDLFHSSRIPSGAGAQEAQLNYIGFSDRRVDDLLDDGLATYELNARARIYGELQAVLADELPYLFAWNERSERVVTDRLGSTSGPLNEESPNMLWQLEALTLRPPAEDP